MPKDLLIEIGMEEIPARFIRNAMDQLKDKLTKWLADSRIGHGEAQAFATPRRIAVRVLAVADKQQDIQEEAKGPAKKIAQDENGNWSKAALGFARSQGVEPENLYFKELGGVEYVYAQKNSVGVETSAVLTEGLQQIITSMTFPKNMRWGSLEQKFVRPIRWLVALLGDAVVPLEIAGVTSGRTSKGHRFLGGDTEISSPSAYEALLKEQAVFVDAEERKGLILQQINAIAAEKGWTIAIKDDLLEEVLFLVEYPTALFGSFDPAFLSIPQEVLITSMREHQRYFPVLDEAGQLLPYFVTVRNGNSESLDVVAKGNEKVLRARLSDARFFYEEDQKLQITAALAKLETIVFHEELGTIGDKVRRIRAIADRLAALIGVDAATAQHVGRAADICKFDLVTQMVYEFPELQGVMGEDYARKAGEPEAVAKAINEHYQPRFSGDASPASIVGAVASIADKIDTIVGCFSIGIIPTGSQDPYALRRQAAGIVQIILDHGLTVKLSQIFDAAIAVLEEAKLLKRPSADIVKDLFDFFTLRVKNVLSESVRYDVADAVLAGSGGIDDVGSVVRRGSGLMDTVGNQADFKTAVDSFNRVANLAAKADSHAIDPAIFAEAVERELYDAWQSVRGAYGEAMASGQEREALTLIGKLKEPITRYFDQVMVMASDEKIKANRLAQLSGIAGDLRSFADFSKIVW